MRLATGMTSLTLNLTPEVRRKYAEQLPKETNRLHNQRGETESSESTVSRPEARGPLPVHKF
jgi:hypothetical protein